MRTLFAAVLALFVGLTLPVSDAEAKRFGGGFSSGMKRSVTPPRQASSSTPARSGAAAASTAGKTGKRSWLGPLAGIAGAIGLAALFSSLGLGEEMADFLMILLLVIGGFMLVRWAMGRRQNPASPMQYAPAGARPHGNPDAQQFDASPVFGGGADNFSDAMRGEPQLPADFDVADFIRNAKRNFIRLQAANDAGDLEDIRDFTTPEIYAEIKLQFEEREGAQQRTDVDNLDAEILDYVQEDDREILSVRFRGQIREMINGPAEPFDEAWHLTRPLDRSHHWSIAGIQQLD